jgi:hypothetical protein
MRAKAFNFIPGKSLKLWLDKKAEENGMSIASYIRSVLLQIKKKETK